MKFIFTIILSLYSSGVLSSPIGILGNVDNISLGMHFLFSGITIMFLLIGIFTTYMNYNKFVKGKEKSLFELVRIPFVSIFLVFNWQKLAFTNVNQWDSIVYIINYLFN